MPEADHGSADILAGVDGCGAGGACRGVGGAEAGCHGGAAAAVARVDILAALADDRLFGPHFRGETWAAWRAFLKALFGLPMIEAELALFRHHTGRTIAPSMAFKEAAL